MTSMVDIETGNNTVDTALVINILRNRINDHEYERALLIAQNQTLVAGLNQSEQLIRDQSEMINELQSIIDQSNEGETQELEEPLAE